MVPNRVCCLIFACAGADAFFEVIELNAPIAEHRLYVYHQPHLYPVARLNDQYPRYAALLLDTNAARLFDFGIDERLRKERVHTPKVSRTSGGGWSQARCQRHTRNAHFHHAKEVVDLLERVVAEENIPHIVVAGDEVIIPTLTRQFPKHLADRADRYCPAGYHHPRARGPRNHARTVWRTFTRARKKPAPSSLQRHRRWRVPMVPPLGS